MRRWIFWLLVVAGILIGILRFAIKLEAQNNSGLSYQSGDLEELNLAAAEKKQYDEWLSNQLVFKSEFLNGKRMGTCVQGAYQFLGITRRSGYVYAHDIPINSDAPTIGAIVKTTESEYGHLAVVIEIFPDRLRLFESNYRGDGVAGIREISRSDPKIKGFITLESLLKEN